MPKTVLSEAKSKEKESNREVLRTQQVVESVVQQCRPATQELCTVVRQPYEESLVKKDTKIVCTVTTSTVSNVTVRSEKTQQVFQDNTTPNQDCISSNQTLNHEGKAIPLFVEDESGRIEEIPNVCDERTDQSLVSRAPETNRSRRLDLEKSTRDYYEKQKALILQQSTNLKETTQQEAVSEFTGKTLCQTERMVESQRLVGVSNQHSRQLTQITYYQKDTNSKKYKFVKQDSKVSPFSRQQMVQKQKSTNLHPYHGHPLPEMMHKEESRGVGKYKFVAKKPKLPTRQIQQTDQNQTVDLYPRQYKSCMSQLKTAYQNA